jgi:hypothetical protein
VKGEKEGRDRDRIMNTEVQTLGTIVHLPFSMLHTERRRLAVFHSRTSFQRSHSTHMEWKPSSIEKTGRRLLQEHRGQLLSSLHCSNPLVPRFPGSGLRSGRIRCARTHTHTHTHTRTGQLQ